MKKILFIFAMLCVAAPCLGARVVVPNDFGVDGTEYGLISAYQVANERVEMLGPNGTEVMTARQKHYEGWIYDVDVPNDIILVRRNGVKSPTPLWSGNSNLNTEHVVPLSFYYGGIAKDGLVLGMTFDEGDGSTARDISFYENHGTINGATWTTDTPSGRGYALSFDGENDYVDCGNDESLNITDEITMEVWVKYGTNPDDFNGMILWKGDNRLNLYSRTVSDELIFTVGDGTNYVGATIPFSDPDFDWTKWNHLVGTYDGTNTKIYLNGVLKNTKTFSGNINTTGKALSIGNRAEPKDLPFNGTIDEVRIYNRALSAEEIRAHYQASAPRHAAEDGVSGGVGYADDFNAGANKFFGVENATTNWSAPVDSSCVLAIKMDENSGTTAHDSSAYANDGTLKNGSVTCADGDCPTWTTGKFGSALSFDGENDYVEVPNSESLQHPDAGTVEYWVKPLGWTINEAGI